MQLFERHGTGIDLERSAAQRRQFILRSINLSKLENNLLFWLFHHVLTNCKQGDLINYIQIQFSKQTDFASSSSSSSSSLPVCLSVPAKLLLFYFYSPAEATTGRLD